jgi:hypothetical protein
LIDSDEPYFMLGRIAPGILGREDHTAGSQQERENEAEGM